MDVTHLPSIMDEMLRADWQCHGFAPHVLVTGGQPTPFHYSGAYSSNAAAGAIRASSAAVVPPFRESHQKQGSLALLRSLVQDHQLVRNHCDPNDEKQLRKFLYARKFDAADAMELMQNYATYRDKHYELLFRDLDPRSPDIELALENCLPGVLPSKDRRGRTILVLAGAQWDCARIPLTTIFRALWLSLEHLLDDIHNQTCGFVIIVDWTEFTFRQSTNLKPSVLRLIIEGLQDCFPAKFKGVHFIGQPWYVETALTIIKPFLREKTKQRIFVHGNNLSTLHDYVHRDVLPADLGGEQPNLNPCHWIEKLSTKVTGSE